jgi:hypothetical protein
MTAGAPSRSSPNQASHPSSDRHRSRLLHRGGDAGGAAPCGCRRLRRGRRSPRCVIHPVEHAAPAVSLDDRNARNHAGKRRNSATPCGSRGNRTATRCHRSSGDRLGRTVRLGLLPRAAATRASLSAPLLPLFLAVPGLHGQYIARPAPAPTASPRGNPARVVVGQLVPRRCSPFVSAHRPGMPCASVVLASGARTSASACDRVCGHGPAVTCQRPVPRAHRCTT